MKKIYLLAISSIITLFAVAKNPHTVNVRVDAKTSIVKWIGSKVAERHEGTINLARGVLVIDHGTLVGGQVAIDMNTIKTTDMSEKYNLKLDKHLKNEDFFNVESFPFAMIKIKNAKRLKDSNIYTIEADLTIKGITNTILFKADVDIKELSFLAKAKIKIDRTRWDITYNSGNFFKDLGDKLILDTIEFDVTMSSFN